MSQGINDGTRERRPIRLGSWIVAGVVVGAWQGIVVANSSVVPPLITSPGQLGPRLLALIASIAIATLVPGLFFIALFGAAGILGGSLAWLIYLGLRQRSSTIAQVVLWVVSAVALSVPFLYVEFRGDQEASGGFGLGAVIFCLGGGFVIAALTLRRLKRLSHRPPKDGRILPT